ncbi:MAG: phenylphosphate carboxylase subunit delta [Bdellovibrio sp.]|nr:phenylphosphate carboxylase subunit delta [Bdellovibrio sp.]
MSNVSEAPDLRALASKFKSKLTHIKVALFDVDGVLTDGRVFYHGEEVGFNRLFHVRDGYGLKMLREAGIKVGIISGGNSLSIVKRFTENLTVDYFFIGSEDKRGPYLKVLSEGFTDEQILYMGDEFFDLPLLKRAGFSAAPRTASMEILEEVDYVPHSWPGNGAVREVIDLLRYAQGIVPPIPGFVNDFKE